MALDFKAKYGPLAGGPDANYPEGYAINVSTPSASDGSPLEKDWVNDQLGFHQKLLDEVGVAASGSPDTVQASQYYDSMIAIMLRENGADSLRSFPLVATMVAATDLSVGDLVMTEGYLAIGVGQALYKVVASGTGVDDGGEFINLNTHQAQLIPGLLVTSSQFGAVGNAVADDAPQIQNLIDAFNTIEIDTESKIAVNLTVTTTHDMRLSQPMTVTNAVTKAFRITGGNTSFTFLPRGTLTGDGVTAGQIGIEVSSTSLVEILYLNISSFLGNGIIFTGVANCMVFGGQVLGATGVAAISIDGGSSHNRIANIKCAGKIGILIDASPENHLDNVVCNGCADAGIQLKNVNSYRNVLKNPICTSSTNVAGGGIHIKEQARDNTVYSPVCRLNAGAGILIEGVSVGNETSRNRIYSPVCEANDVNGITITLGLDTEIISPILRSNTGHGVLTEDCVGPKIIGGRIVSNTADGVRHNSSLNTLEEGVTISGNTGRGVFITDTGSLTPESFRTINCHLENNTAGEYGISGTGLGDAKALNCTGWVTNNAGVAYSISDSGTIPHGLSGNPNLKVFLTTTTSTVLVTLQSTSPTTFAVNLIDVITGLTFGGTVNISWQASLF